MDFANIICSPTDFTINFFSFLKKIKGLFKSKPLTSAEIVRLTRDLLVKFDMDSICESKLDEKVNHTIMKKKSIDQ